VLPRLQDAGQPSRRPRPGAAAVAGFLCQCVSFVALAARGGHPAHTGPKRTRILAAAPVAAGAAGGLLHNPFEGA